MDPAASAAVQSSAALQGATETLGGNRGKAALATATARLGAAGSDEAIRRAAEDFEAVFLSQMLAPMFEELGQDPLFGGGPGEEIYRSLLVEEYGKAVARSGGIGIADAVQREMLRMQEVGGR